MAERTIHFTSLGCPKNFVDSEVMIGILEQRGWSIVETPEEAVILLVNTCGFIQPAVEEGIDEILGLAECIPEDGSKKLVVAGCMVQRYREKLMKELPEIDLLVGTESVKDIGVILDEYLSGADDRFLHMADEFLMDARLPRRIATPSFRAWMKITEGCNNHCSYCMIPSIRGRLRSRSVADLSEEAATLARQGVKEITLIAQDLTAYGDDLGKNNLLVELLEEILQHTSIPWIRLLYLYPSGIADELLKLMATNPRIVPYLDIPFQHVSDRVLKSMRRRYGHDELLALVDRIRHYLPEVALRTTFLLGFPGESEEDILLLERFLERARIDHVGVFGYANEEGSPSESFSDQIAAEEISTRVDHILSLQSAISQENLKRYVGKVEPVLVEGVSRETELLLEGRTRYQAPDIDGCVLINDGQANAGDIVNVKIDESQVYDLVGGIV